MSDQAPRISLVIPCRNESARLPATLQALDGFLDARTEVVIVVEKSSDNTVELARASAAKDPRFRVIENTVGRGKGFAVKTGMLAAAGEIVFFMDADLSVPLRFIPEFMGYFDRDEADVVIGSRRHRESVIPRSQPLLRVVYGRIFNICLRLLGVTKFKDTQCGFKAFRREVARKVFSQITLDGFGFDVEALVLAEDAGYRVIDRPVEWSDAPGSKVSALRDGISSFCQAVLAARRARGKNVL